ncbi:hypothetical protein [Paenibacillus sp. XY044]|uniref:hypothetical protein n=1 Tax=Paenibacillus sp. XY044 TaxID=2026089 RepID=UPI0015C6665E|nr:hypothetical protein [Paenibacillus sp. XY044]
MIHFLLDVIGVVVLYLVISLIWMAAEKLIYGQITPRFIDDVVALVLAVSLYFNFK